MAVRKRVRGVIASRNKLEIAMLNAGIRSQSELAQLIAEKESLNSPPKDLVNRTFRQKRVSHQTITRIASVLGISPHSLFLTQEEIAREEPIDVSTNLAPNSKDIEYPTTRSLVESTSPEPEHIQKELENTLEIPPELESGSKSTNKLPSRWKRKISVISVIVLTVMSIPVILFFHTSDSSVIAVIPPNNVNSLMIIKGESRLEDEVAKELAAVLKKEFTISSASVSDIAAKNRPYSLPDRFDVELVISIELIEKDIFKAILVNAYTSSTKKLIATFLDSNVVTSKSNIANIVSRIELELSKYLSSTDFEYFGLNEREVRNYLSSQALLYKGLNEENVNAALEKTHLILETAPGNTLALAQLCNLYAQKMYLTADKNYLTHAKRACELAQQDGQKSPEVLFATAQTLRREGALDKSIELYNEAITINPNYSMPYIGLTESYLKQFLMNKNIEALSLAKESIAKAEALQNDNWMIPFINARMHYYEGDTDLALAKFEESKAIKITQNVLANLGSIYFCDGQIKEAYNNYKAIEQNFGASNISNHLLATTSFYTQKFEEAINYNLRSLDTMAEANSEGLYQIWINLGDSYFALKLNEKAQDAYQQALRIAERSTDSNSVEIDRLYAYLKITLIRGTFSQGEVQADIHEKLKMLDLHITDPGAKFRAMVIWAYIGEKVKAREKQQQLISQCKGLALYPGVEKILN